MAKKEIKKYLLNDDEGLSEGLSVPFGSGDEVDPEVMRNAQEMADSENQDVTIAHPDDPEKNIIVTPNVNEGVISVRDLKSTILSEVNGEIDLTEQDIMNILVSNEDARMTKSELIQEIQSQIIKENNMNGNIRRDLDGGSTDYSEHLDAETVKRLADEMFSEIRTNAQQKGGTDIGRAQRLMLQGIQNTQGIERQNREELEQLAIELTMEEYGISEGSIEFDARLVPMGGIDMGDIRMQAESINTNTTLTEDEEETPRRSRTEEELKPEKTKRRLINAMMHGAGRKGQYLYHMSDKLREIDPSLPDEYSNIMMGNDLTYWAMSDGDILHMGQNMDNEQHAGNVKVLRVGREIPKVIAQGITFPMLLHELSKGVMEVIGLWGLQGLNKEEEKIVTNSIDHLENETWDIRLGPKIWEKVSEIIPDEAKEYKSILLSDIYQLPAEEFNSLISGILNNNQESIDYIVNLSNEIVEDIKQEDMEDTMSQFRNDDEGGGEEDSETPTFDGEGEVDDVLGNGEEEEEEEDFDPSTLSGSELQELIDQALDDGDFESVKYLSQFQK